MVELGGHFLLFFCKSKQFFNVQVHCILKVTSLVQVESSIQGMKYFNQGSICGTHTGSSEEAS